MIDFEDMLGLGLEEEPEIVDSHEAQPDCETSMVSFYWEVQSVHYGQAV